MEKKSKSIILGVVIVLLIVIIGVTIFFVTKQIVENGKNTQSGPQDASENIPSDTISTPTDNDEANTLNYILTQ